MTDSTDSLPPYDELAEQSVIGALLMNPDIFVSLAAFLEASDFFLQRHAYIWNAFSRLYRRGDSIDYNTVAIELKNMGVLDEIGGMAYLTLCINNTSTSIYAEMYARLVHRASTRRKLLQAVDEMRSLALNEELELEMVLSQSAEKFLDVQSRQQERRGHYMVAAINAVLDDVDTIYGTDTEFIGVPTGFPDLDDIKKGIEPGELVVLAGRPGMGKSALCGNIALNAGKKGYRVAMFPNEMSERAVIRRMIAAETGISSARIRLAGRMKGHEYSTLIDVSGQIAKLPIYIDDSLIRPSQIESACRWLRKTSGLDLVIIDGMYHMSGDGKYSGSNQNYLETSAIVKALKHMAKTLRLPVIATHQLSRAVEQRQNKRPVQSDLRDSGKIEEEADSILFVYRDVVYNEATEFPNQADIIIAKNREGSPGTISLYFDKTIPMFRNGAARYISLNEDDARAHERRMGGK